MDLLSFLGMLVRRWYVVLPLLLGTLGLATYSWSVAPRTYETTATVLLRFPIGVNQEMAGRNPYLGYGNLSVPARVVTDVLTSPEYVREADLPGTYVAEVDTTTQAPIIAVQSRDQTPAGSTTTTFAVIDGISEVLQDRQEAAGAPEESWLTAEVVEAPDEPLQLNTSRIRAAGGVLALGALFAVGAGMAAEARHRRGRVEVRILSASNQAPCGICGDWIAEDRLISHIELQHGLSRTPRAVPAPEEQPARTSEPSAVPPPDEDEAPLRLRAAGAEVARPPQHRR